MKWLHWRIRSVVPLICAGAWRASSIVRREPPATPAPATVRNFRRLRVEVLTGCGSLIVSLLDYPETDLVHGATTPEELTSLCFRGTSCQVASEVNARPRPWVLSSAPCAGRSWHSSSRSRLSASWRRASQRCSTPRARRAAPRGASASSTSSAPRVTAPTVAAPGAPRSSWSVPATSPTAPASVSAPTSTSSTSSRTAARPSGGRACRPSAPPSRRTRSASSSPTCASSVVRADSGEALDAEQDDLIVLLTDGQLDAVPGLWAHGIQQRRLGRDRHQFHGAHPEPLDGVVADENEIRRGARDDRAPYLVSGGPEAGAADAGGERRRRRAEHQRGGRASLSR